jgi:hypothetical protein
MKVKLHPDGFVVVDQYLANLGEFAEDLGKSLPELPPGMVSFEYDTDSKIMVYYDAKHNAFPIPGEAEFPVLCEAVEKHEELQAKMEARSLAKREAFIASLKQQQEAVQPIKVVVP